MSSNFQFSKKDFRPYEKTRPWKNRGIGCLAPVSSLFVGLRGKIYGCCFNKTYPLGTYPEQSLSEIWAGSARKKQIEALKSRDFALGCQTCGELIAGKNYAGLPAKNYEDLPRRMLPYPTKIEFELDNTCNLECVICRGEFSSAIRKNREGLPPIPSPYGAAFMEELKRFIPHLKQAHFLGGEPFLITRYLEIWDLIAEMKPDIEISLQTNGTILTQRIRTLLAKLRFNIGISLDSIDPNTYAVVRKNGNFEKVWKNVQELRAYCREQGTNFHISYCPMTQNWKELPEVIRQCNALNCTVYFNKVYYPKECSFTSLSRSEMENVKQYLEQNLTDLPSGSDIERKNKTAYQGVINLLNHWLETGSYVTVTYNSVEAYLAGLKKFVLSQQAEPGANEVYQDLANKIDYMLEKATAQGLRSQAEEKLRGVPHQDLYDHGQNVDAAQLMDNFRNFLLPME